MNLLSCAKCGFESVIYKERYKLTKREVAACGDSVGNNLLILYYVIAGFAVLGGIDYLLGSKFGIGRDFEKGIMLGAVKG